MSYNPYNQAPAAEAGYNYGQQQYGQQYGQPVSFLVLGVIMLLCLATRGRVWST